MYSTLIDAFAFAEAISAATDVEGDTSRQATLTGVVIGLQVVSFIVVCVRLFARMFVTQRSGMDDWVIIAATLVSIANTVMVGMAATAGAGMHANALTESQQNRINDFVWYGSMLNGIAAMLVRASLLVFFLRVFPTRGVRTVSIILLVLTSAFGIGWFFAVVFQCVPFGSAAVTVKRCINFALFYRSIAIISMVLDFAILLTPIPSLYKLRLTWRTRLSILLVFVIGFVPCIASVFRVYFASGDDHSDSIYQLGLQIISGLAELHMAIICACVAGLRPLVTRYFPNILGPSWSTSDTRPPTSELASYVKATGTFSHSKPQVSRRYSDPLELCDIGRSTGEDGEVSGAQIITSTQTFMDGSAGVVTVPKVEGNVSSQHERERKG